MLNGKMISIRMSGLGGQGVVTAAHILGHSATMEGKESTVNPFFGAEKRLAPTESYVRISDDNINERGEILYPNVIVIFHPHVITLGKCYTMPFYQGLLDGGIIIINSDVPLDIKEEDLAVLKAKKAKIYYLPATQLAMEIGGTELSTNIAMLGGIMKVTNLVSLDILKNAISERFGGTKKFVASATTAALDDVLKSKFGKLQQLVEKNMEVVAKAMESVTEFSLN
jgi:pyruvate ferredoxin oxidoreductase gamma subunit